MTSYSKGRAFEYRIRHHLESKGFVVFRTAGSHSPADLIALRFGEVWLVQCKGTNGYLAPAERDKLTALASELGIMAVVAFKDKRKRVCYQVIGGLAGKNNASPNANQIQGVKKSHVKAAVS